MFRCNFYYKNSKCRQDNHLVVSILGLTRSLWFDCNFEINSSTWSQVFFLMGVSKNIGFVQNVMHQIGKVEHIWSKIWTLVKWVRFFNFKIYYLLQEARQGSWSGTSCWIRSSKETDDFWDETDCLFILNLALPFTHTCVYLHSKREQNKQTLIS